MKIAIAGSRGFILAAKLPGIFNLTSPFPVDNATFTKTLGGFRFDFPTAGETLRNLVENIEESH